MQSEEYKKGYHAGYHRGIQRKWGEHLPPSPPDVRVNDLMEAAHNLRDMADTYCATLPAGDEMRSDFEPLIDQIDNAFIKITKWIGEYKPEK